MSDSERLTQHVINPGFPVRPRRIAGIVLTVIFGPGIGHLFLGKWKRAFLWFGLVLVPLLLAPFTMWPLAGWFVLGRIGAAVDVGLVAAQPAQIPRLRVALLVWLGLSVIGTCLGTMGRMYCLEAFKIPATSGAPTLLIGDHIMVRKYEKEPVRGDVVVFVHPCQTDRDFVKRVVALEGDSVEIRCTRVYVNGKVVDRKPISGDCRYQDRDFAGHGEEPPVWREQECSRYEETVDGKSYELFQLPDTEKRIQDANATKDPGNVFREDFPGEEAPDCRHHGSASEVIGTIESSGDGTGCGLRRRYIVPAGHFFVLGDNRPNSNDSRYWGSVPLQNIKGKAAYIFWASQGDKGSRWQRIGKGLR